MTDKEMETAKILTGTMVQMHGVECLKDENVLKKIEMSAIEIVKNNKIYQDLADKLKPFTFEMIQRLCIMTAQNKKCRIPEASKYVRKQIRKGKTYKQIAINISNLKRA